MIRGEAYTITHESKSSGFKSNPKTVVQNQETMIIKICTLKSHGEVSMQDNLLFLLSLWYLLSSYKPPALSTSKSNKKFKAVENESCVASLGLSCVCVG